MREENNIAQHQHSQVKENSFGSEVFGEVVKH